MKIDRITTSESHETSSPMGLRTWYKLEASASIEDGEDKKRAVEDLKRFVRENLFPPGIDYQRTDLDRDVDKHWYSTDPKEQRIQTFINDIEACTTIDEVNGKGVQVGLVAFKDISNTEARIKAAYDLQYLKLKK